VALCGASDDEGENLGILVMDACPHDLVTQVLMLVATAELRVRGFLSSLT
jgi:hypothetical protein